MDQNALLSLAGFALVTSVTPGPNNLMLMASGANYGFRRTVPHMAGIGLGFTLMVALVGLGLMGAFEAWPRLQEGLTALCLLYIAWLAWKVATAAAPGTERAGGRPMRFLEAALFQWVNPKAWAMALTAVTVYAPTGHVGTVLAVALVFGAVNLPSVSLWTVLGQGVARLLRDARWLRTFNALMAALLILSVLPML